eukprot:SAG31_NODE_4107_length_3576_cov_19.051769_1_plen_154_part_00
MSIRAAPHEAQDQLEHRQPPHRRFNTTSVPRKQGALDPSRTAVPELRNSNRTMPELELAFPTEDSYLKFRRTMTSRLRQASWIVTILSFTLWCLAFYNTLTVKVSTQSLMYPALLGCGVLINSMQDADGETIIDGGVGALAFLRRSTAVIHFF